MQAGQKHIAKLEKKLAATTAALGEKAAAALASDAASSTSGACPRTWSPCKITFHCALRPHSDPAFSILISFAAR